MISLKFVAVQLSTKDPEAEGCYESAHPCPCNASWALAIEIDTSIEKIEKLNEDLHKTLTENKVKEPGLRILEILKEHTEETKRLKRLFDAFARERLRLPSELKSDSRLLCCQQGCRFFKIN